MIIKRINPSGKASTLAMGQPRKRNINSSTHSLEFTVDPIRVGDNDTLYQLSMSQAELELLLEDFRKD